MKNLTLDIIIIFMSTMYLSSLSITVIRCLSIRAGILNSIGWLYDNERLKPTYVRFSILTMGLLCGIGHPNRNARKGDTYINVLLYQLFFTILIGLPSAILLYSSIDVLSEKTQVLDALFIVSVLLIYGIFVAKVIISYQKHFLSK